ncbi:MAG: hypothetical protein KKB51_03645 [Candidatus Riflebacteria bacterium]|nr:hypothetical protein [Candidatus Riflebacteria bacterium]
MLALVFTEKEVSACGKCVFAIADRLFPPVYFWSLIILVAFFSASILASTSKVKLTGIPGILKALVLIAFCSIMGIAFFGPFLILPLAIPTTLAFFRSFLSSGVEAYGKKVCLKLRILGLVTILAMISAVYQGFRIYENRTDAQYIVQWQGTGTAMAMLKQLQQLEPASLADYRYILKHAKGIVLRNAAERVSIIGDPKIDIRNLEEAIDRTRRLSSDQFVVQGLEESLRVLKLQVDAPKQE